MDMEGLGISDIIEDEEIEVMGTGSTDEETEVMGTGGTEEETEEETDEETDEETEVTTPEESSTVLRIDFIEGVISPDNRFCSFLRPG